MNTPNDYGIHERFPFKTFLTFDYLLDFWQQQALSSNYVIASIAKEIVKKIDEIPEFKGVISDYSILKQHKELIELMIGGVFSNASCYDELRFATVPFKMDFFYATSSFENLWKNTDVSNFFSNKEAAEEMLQTKILHAYLSILTKYYNRPFACDTANMIYKIKELDSGLERYYRILINVQFVDVEVIGELPHLSVEDQDMLLANMLDMDLWMKVLPPNKFVFKGFTLAQLVDVTEQEVSAQIKQELLKKDILTSPEKFNELESSFRSLLRLPELEVGIAFFHKDKNALVGFGHDKYCMMLDVDIQKNVCPHRASLFENLFNKRNPVVIEDLRKTNIKDPWIEDLLARNICTILLSPLLIDDKVVGILQVGSTKLGDLNPLKVITIKNLLPVLAIAVKKSTDELENNIQKVIKDKFTFLHPTVEWKFREVALQYIETLNTNTNPNIGEIVFDGVYPLYGASDIKNSSSERNAAIQADLSEQLILAKNVFLEADQQKGMPIYRELIFNIDKYLERLRKQLLSQDEAVILEFLKFEIEPILRYLSDNEPSISASIQEYFAALNPELGLVYKKRKGFEDSVKTINHTIAELLDNEEKRIQSMFPFYSESYKTDGLEYNFYIGQSLVKDKRFHQMHLRNLRLWQLMIMCQIARKTHEISDILPVHLNTTQLILVQSSPLAIRFRTDEKKFDVDGTYNVRYEILKKRIDKALIKGTEERLTKVGTVAIVYSNKKEEEEYRNYLQYLKNQDFIEGEEEYLDLQDLQGVSGLKAIRFKVNILKDPVKLNSAEHLVEESVII
ncbi:MAG: hypothetical protein OHK0038_04220 [Flammeovirgaceae bacterium]